MDRPNVERCKRGAIDCDWTFSSDEALTLIAYIAHLESQLGIAREAIEFYANKETYGSEDHSRRTGNRVFDIVCFDFDRSLEPGKDFAGRRARAALAKLNNGTQRGDK